MAKAKLHLLDVLIGAAKRHGHQSDDLDQEVDDLRQLLRFCWTLLNKEQKEAIGIAALDSEGLDLAQWMKPRRIEFGGVRVERG